MKSQLLLSLDHEVIHALRQEGNMSGYVNRLLIKNLQGGSTKEDIQKAITEQAFIISKAQTKLDKLKKKLAEKPKTVWRQT